VAAKKRVEELERENYKYEKFPEESEKKILNLRINPI